MVDARYGPEFTGKQILYIVSCNAEFSLYELSKIISRWEPDHNDGACR